MAKYDKVVEFYNTDFPRTLFPLMTNKVLIDNAASELGDYVYQSITHADTEHNFLPQTKAYAAKANHHLRRTFKLDPIAEFFLYDIVYRHRTALKTRRSNTRNHFSYQFKQGSMVSAAAQYRTFRQAVHDSMQTYRACVKLDIAQYFNSIYHHDLIHWFRDYAKTDEDAQFLGKFLRQINSGRSIDCLPHGIYPSKVLGSQFLKFIDDSSRIRCDLLLRFMDDIYLFDDSEDVLKQDFHQLQRLLGEKGLSVNASKTEIGQIDELNIEEEVDDVKKSLLIRRGWVLFNSGGEEILFEDPNENLDDDEIAYLLDLLNGGSIEEEDAELVLSLLRDHTGDVLTFVPYFLENFASLTKNIYYFAKYVEDKESLVDMLNDYLDDAASPTEYQLFWIAKLCEDELLNVTGIGDLLTKLYEHPQSTVLSKSKILEIPESRFGMPDLREEEIRTGASSWLSWSSAIGSRKLRKAQRNHLLGYFANGSALNRIIADCVKRL